LNLNEKPVLVRFPFYLAVALYGAAVLFFEVSSKPFLPGADAYYYALQADWWARTGHLRIPDPSILFPLMGVLQRGGLSTETAVRLVLVLLVFVTTLVSLRLSQGMGNPDYRSLAFGWIFLSPSLLFTVIEFPKMGGILLALPLALWVLNKPWGEVWACGILLVAGLFHKAALPLAGLLLLALCFARGRTTYSSWKTWASLGALLAALVIGILHFFSWDDLQRLAGGHPLPGVWSLLLRDSMPLPIKLEILLCHGALLAVIGWYWKNSPSKAEILIPLSLLVPAWFPLGTEQVLGVGERYALLSPLLAGWGACYLLIRQPLGAEADTRKHQWLFYVVGVASLVAAPFRLGYSHPPRLDPDNASFNRLAGEIGPKNIPMLICRQDLHFFYKFETKKEAFSYEPEDGWDKTRIWRVTYGITPQEIESRLPAQCQGQFERLAVSGYGLIREDCWDQFRTKVKWDEDSSLYDLVYYSWLNPAVKRPAFLYAKHKGDAGSDFPALK
jgi:hypothetical protein